MTLANIPDQTLIQIGFGTPMGERNDLYALVHTLSYQLAAVKRNILDGRSQDEVEEGVSILNEYADRIKVATVAGHHEFETVGAIQQVREELSLDLRSLANAMEDGRWSLAQEWEKAIWSHVKGLRQGLFLLHLATNPEVLR